MEKGRLLAVAATTVDRLLLLLLGGTALVIPLFVQLSAKEPFREPKAILFRIAALLIGSLLVWQWALGRIPRIPRRPALVLFLILFWTLVTTLFSTNPILSWLAFWHAVAAAILFVAAFTSAPSSGRVVILATLIAAVAVATVAILQATALWSPFDFAHDLGHRATVTSFLGNPNDVGGWLVVPALLALGVAFAFDRWKRWVGVVAFALFSLGVLVSGSATALLSLVLSTAWLIARSISRRHAGVAILALLIVSAIGWAAAHQERLVAKGKAAQTGVDDLLRARLLGWTTAAMMFRDRPLVGVGPGAYGWNYLDYQAAAQQDDERFEAGRYRSGFFEEVHNDYLEIAAETGAPGLLLTALSFWVFLRPGHALAPSREEDFARAIGPPLLLSLAVQMATNFPLQISAVLATYLLVGGTVFSWRMS